MGRIYFWFLVFFLLVMVSCNQSPTPKPVGYPRIDLPGKSYRILDSVYPYSFQIPVYSHISPDPLSPGEPNWINIDFPAFRGSIHVSYMKLNGDLAKHIEDARAMALTHMSHASGIRQIGIRDKSRSVYGLCYDIRGTGAASPYQFYLTDSIHHFMRGALYFNTTPNNDSLAPVIDFIEKDIQRMIETLRWK
jgi:gliding motility-associated lipoprotein GldD